MVNTFVINPVRIYEEISCKYDELSKKYMWYSPQILFGLHFKYIYPDQDLLDLGIGTGQSSELYKKYGFVSIGVRKKYYSDGKDAILMEKMLG